MIFWGVIAQGAPAIITRAAGVPYSLDTELINKKSTNSRSCKYTLQGEVLDYAFPDHICTNKAFYHNHQNTVKVKLIGYKTILGFYITNIYGVGAKE
jgi:hypothetical protein